MCNKTEQDFWEATYREIDIAIQAALKFEKDHDLPRMALLATWTAIQHRSEKLVEIDKLLGNSATNQPMSKTEMVANVYWVHEKAVELQKKKEEEAKLREEQPDDGR
jgi:hypothetical protein